MKAVARHARRQDPLAEVLDQDRKGDPQRQVRFVQVETEQNLSKRLVADEHERRLEAGDEGATELAGAKILAAGNVQILQIEIGEQGGSGVEGAPPSECGGRTPR